ncbi:hypothetical protein D3C80_1549690 [compost metagenome]
MFFENDEMKIQAIKKDYSSGKLHVIVDDKPELIEVFENYEIPTICINAGYNQANQFSNRVIRSLGYENNELYGAVQKVLR